MSTGKMHTSLHETAVRVNRRRTVEAALLQTN